jgi:acyl transferase domain-containing protein
VTLPTYPFERQRYWIEPANPSAGNSNPIVPAAKTSDIAEWFYVPSWKRALASQMDHSETIKSVALSWLVFVDDYGVGAEIVSGLNSYGQSVISVRSAEEYSKISDNLYTISPKAATHYEDMLHELRKSGRVPSKIIHCWSVTHDEVSAPQINAWEKAQDLGCHSLISGPHSVTRKGADAIWIYVVSEQPP